MDTSEVREVRSVLQKFQDGYTRRDIARVEDFMELFAADPDVEVIGTAAVVVQDDEWHIGREAARNLVENDWKDWGDLLLNVAEAHIHVEGNVAWLATSGTVSMNLPANTNYANYLDYILIVLGQQELSPEERLVEILRGGTNTVFEARRGDDYVWPIRFSAVLVKRDGHWRFHNMQFSYPTTRFPDVRLVA